MFAENFNVGVVGKTYSYFRVFIYSIVLWLISLPVSAQFYYGLRQDYGKNRVQYNEFDWVFYRFERFDVYFYRGNDELAAQVARMTDKQLPAIENLLDAPLDERVQILVFNNLSDLKQSNVNSSEDEDYNTGGVTRISGRRLFVYFDGNYVHLEENLRAGLAEVVLSNLVYGSFTKSIRNSALLNLPEWYTEGLISFIGNPNSEEVDVHVRDAFLEGKYKNINSLVGDDAEYAGHSIWQYITDVYGRKMLKNVVYMAIVNRNIESGFLYILGKDLNSVIEGWKAYLSEKYSNIDALQPLPQKPLLKIKKNYRLTHMATSRDGRYLAYVTQKFSRYKVYLYDFEKDKRKRLLTHGFRIAQNADYSYPLLAWHPNGKLLAMITEEEGFTFLSFYDVEKKEWEKKKFFKFDKILSFSYSEDGKRFVLSATKNGQSDIFIYTILNTKVEQLTNDTWSDLEPAWIQNDKRVVFRSNRLTDTLKPRQKAIEFPKKTFDLYAMPAHEPADTTVIWQLTNTPQTNETMPTAYADGFVAFLSDREATRNQQLIKIDSNIAFVDTATHYDYSFTEYPLSDYRRSILDHAYLPERDIQLELAYDKQRYKLYQSEYITPEELQLTAVDRPKAHPDSLGEEAPPESLVNPAQSSTVPLYYPGVDPSHFEINIDDYQFEDAPQNERPSSRRDKPQARPVKILPTPANVAELPEEKPLEIPPKRNYFLSFYQDDFTVGFDNVFNNPQYQKFTGVINGDLLNSGFNMQLKAGVLDLMHDYRVTGAMSTNFQPLAGTSLAPNSEFLVAVSDLKKRLDKTYIFDRRSQVQLISFLNYRRIITNEVTTKYSWPFNPVASLRGSIGYRIDENIQLSRDANSVEVPTTYQDYAILRLAYVYDNTRKLGLNIYSGLRYKIFTEYYRNLYRKPTGLHTAGIDLRNYTVIHRNLIWANRFAFGTSFGPEKLIYIMGGVDNTFSPRTDNTTPIATDNNYIFQTLATNMRGFYQNTRNGNSFSVINSELRWPIFSYLMNRPIKSDFIKNFQVVGFGDIGTAWNGFSPYSDENAINSKTINRGNLKIVLDSQKEPIIAGYGVGLRTRLFGYFLRFDWAWGVEDGNVMKPLFTFSLGTDF